MPLVIDGFQHWLTTILTFPTDQENSTLMQMPCQGNLIYLLTLSKLFVILPAAETLTVTAPVDEITTTTEMANIDWRKEQREDQTLARVIEILENGKDNKKETNSVQKYLRERKKLVLSNGVLYRNSVLDGERVLQLCLPEHFKDVAFVGIHSEVGHPGIEKTVWLGRQRFYWPGQEHDITKRVEACERCIRRKTPVRHQAKLHPIFTMKPLEILCIDFLSLEKCKGGYENILVITDHFTRYAQAIPLKNQLATTTAKALYDNFIVHYSFPERLHSDQGRNFESSIIRELCKLAKIKKSRTTPYHPEGNGSVERFNQTLLKMLGTLEENQKSDWKSYVPSLVHAYNAMKNDATGFSPHFLMFGWHPRLSIDAFLGTDPGNEGAKDYQTYVQKLQDRLQYS
jgi:transposase InsO family protein